MNPRLDLRARLRPLARKLLRRDPYARLDPARVELVDYAFEGLGARSFADLGGIWGVDGGYTFYALERHKPERAVLVDTDVPSWVQERARRFRRLRVLTANFSDPAVAREIGEVDAIFLFDVLLHQVTSDWNEVLQLCSPLARIVLLDEIHPQHGRPWRDVHNIWQWGITDGDLVSTMRDCGYALELERSFAPFKGLERFECRAFVFVR
jgi:hypothetical protein